jgi:hypothetical protein
VPKAADQPERAIFLKIPDFSDKLGINVRWPITG